MNKVFALTAAIAFAATSCNPKIAEPSFNDAQVEINYKNLNVFVADQPEEQRLGLSIRDQLPESEGMVFTYDQLQKPSFWMKGMKFPIDIIWIRNNRVVDLSLYLQPEPGKEDRQLKLYTPKTEVDMVLEVSSGWATKNDIQLGDEVKLLP